MNAFAGRQLVLERTLFRGGKIDFVDNAEAIGNPRFIINLRRGQDPDLGIPSIQIAADDRLENYETTDPTVRRWLVRVVDLLASPDAEPPVLIHCAAGRDRTGVVVAAVLTVIGVADEFIIADYLMTDGKLSESRIRMALDGLGGFRESLKRYREPLVRKFGATDLREGSIEGRRKE